MTINTNYINKIGALYPVDSKTHAPIFHISYDEAPMPYKATLYMALVAIDLTKEYIVNLTVESSDGVVKLSNDLKFDKENFLKQNQLPNLDIASGTFTIDTAPFIINDGIYFYNVTAILKDAFTNQVYDSIKTHFVTLPESESEPQD